MRLTHRDKYGRMCSDGSKASLQIGNPREGHPSILWGDAVDKLAAYEDTGLEPEEISNIIKGCNGIDRQDWMVTLFGKPLNEWYEIAKAEEQGRLVVLPCKVGDTVYALVRFCDGTKGDCGSWVSCDECDDYRQEVSERRIGTVAQAVSAIELLGKTVFLTREEAEAALKGKQDGTA